MKQDAIILKIIQWFIGAMEAFVLNQKHALITTIHSILILIMNHNVKVKVIVNIIVGNKSIG